MSAGVIAALANLNRTRRPEDSIALRVAALGAVSTGVLALAVEGAVNAVTAGLVLSILPIAYLVSWHRRGEDNWLIKILVATGAVTALIVFFRDLGSVDTFDAIRFPLAKVFLTVQVLHSFDLPQRRDLAFSLGSSLALMATAASVSHDLSFGPVALLYSAFALAGLVLWNRSVVRDGSSGALRTAAPRSRRDGPAAQAVRAGAVTLFVGAAAFLLLPQTSTPRSLALPFSLGRGLGVPAEGGIANPGFVGAPGARSSGGSYFGVSERMDLRVRGDLSDELVMRVRASAPAMWRGAVFDTYDGIAWSGDSGDPTPLPGGNPYWYPSEHRSLGARAPLTQTFYLETEQPSVVFASNQPEQLWFEGSVGVDSLGGLRTDSTLTEGLVYSVVSTRGAAPPAALRAATGPSPETWGRYLQLPDDLPERVGALARRVTEGETNDYDRVLAVQDHLRRHFRYTLDSPVPPEGRDAVDHFLFDARTGFCEQFASAAAVMLRTLGIPARVATGYTPGGRNPFTGFYEVRASDAHAWIEAWFPRLGWYDFDPTFDVPPARPSAADLLPLSGAIRVASRWIAARPASAWAGAGMVAAVLALGTGLWLYRRGARGRAAEPERADLGPVAAAFRGLERALAKTGAGRRTAETAAELLRRTAGSSDPEARGALEAFQGERYGPRPPTPEDERAAILTLERLANQRKR